MSNMKLTKLFEGELEQAETILAAKEVISKLQDIAEDLAKMTAGDIMPLVDMMKNNFNIASADKFNKIAMEQIQNALNATTDAKDHINNEILRLQGKHVDEPAGNDMALDTETPPADDAGAEETPADSDTSLEDPFAGAEATSGPADEPLGREKKESVTNSKAPINESLESLIDWLLNEAEARLGTGKRFNKLEKSLRAKGSKNPDALAAWIGRKKYGNKHFNNLSHHTHEEKTPVKTESKKKDEVKKESKTVHINTDSMVEAGDNAVRIRVIDEARNNVNVYWVKRSTRNNMVENALTMHADKTGIIDVSSISVEIDKKSLGNPFETPEFNGLVESFESTLVTERKTKAPSMKKGDEVMFNGKKTTVEVPDGPGDLVGVKHRGKVKMVPKNEVSCVKETFSNLETEIEEETNQWIRKNKPNDEQILESLTKLLQGYDFTFMLSENSDWINIHSKRENKIIDLAEKLTPKNQAKFKTMWNSIVESKFKDIANIFKLYEDNSALMTAMKGVVQKMTPSQKQQFLKRQALKAQQAPKTGVTGTGTDDQLAMSLAQGLLGSSESALNHGNMIKEYFSKNPETAPAWWFKNQVSEIMNEQNISTSEALYKTMKRYNLEESHVIRLMEQFKIFQKLSEVNGKLDRIKK